jgi:transcriptional regulator with XRE-family HTH domain
MIATFKSHFGERLLNQREKLGLTQAQLAEQSGLKREMIGRYERGAVLPGIGVLHKLEAHGVDIAYLLTGRPASLAKEEEELVAAYRAMDGVSKAGLLGMVRGVQAQHRKIEKAKGAKGTAHKGVKP